MAKVNGYKGRSSVGFKEILNTVGNFPYVQETIKCPETANIADEVVFELGDALKIDSVSGKLARYEDGDSEDIIGIVADLYDGVELHAEGSQAGYVDAYTFGRMKKELVFKSNGAGDRIAFSYADSIKARKLGIYLG